MIGHEPLIEVRRKGVIPKHGVRIELGCIDPLMARNWHRKLVRLSQSVVMVEPSDDTSKLDLMWLRGMPTILVAREGAEKSRLSALVQNAISHDPRTLVVVTVDSQNVPSKAWALDDGEWNPIRASGVNLWSI